MNFHLRFNQSEIPALAARYLVMNKEKNVGERDETLEAPSREAKTRGYLLKNEFLMFCRWKSARRMDLAEENRESLIEEVSAIAFSAKAEELRIGALVTLQGVAYPIASAILHWVSKEKYPIFDVRALWSLGIENVPVDNFIFWSAYTLKCREIAQEVDVTMRDLDRALWQYSYKNQSAPRSQSESMTGMSLFS